MSGHTPGPWTWDEPSNWRGLGARVYVSEPYGLVAQVPVEAWRPRSMGRANARLIAAAPELLSALRLFVATETLLDKILNTPERDRAQWLKPAMDAIAKAEGRS